MATLKNLSSGKCIILNALHLVGRAKNKVDTVLSDNRVSQLHASIRFTGGVWMIVDHSRNGTKLSGKKLTPNKETPIKKMDTISFIQPSKEQWCFLDDSPPKTYLKSLSDVCNDIDLQSMNFIPNDEKPLASLFLGYDNQWIYSDAQGEKALADNDVIALGEHGTWQLISVNNIAATQEIEIQIEEFLKRAVLRFSVSQDEEQVELNVEYGDKTFGLGVRAHHYLTMLMALKKIDDMKQSHAPNTQGWQYKDQLQKMLGIDHLYMNLQLFRIKKQISATFNLDLDIFEKKPGQIRISSNQFVIKKEGSKEIQSLNQALY